MEQQSTLKIVLALMRVLSHKVRTPLSVISNDLSYFQTLIEPSECERGILKCRQVSDTFKPAQLLHDGQGNIEEFTLSSLLEEVYGDLFQTKQSDFMLKGVKGNFQQALKWLSELFAIESVEIIDKQCSENIFFVPTMIKFAFSRSYCFVPEDGVEKSQLVISSFTDIYSATEHDDNILPMLIDSVLHSFSAGSRIVNNREIEIFFQEAS